MYGITVKKVLIDDAGNVVHPKTKLPLDLPNKPATGIRINKVTLEPKARVFRTQNDPNGHWEFDMPMGANGEFGFIYLIHDTVNDKRYLGKKQFLGTGKINQGQETNWRWYTSSCNALNEQMKLYEKELFKFYCIEQYKIRGSLGYAEGWSLMHVEALAKRDKWYNGLVNKVSWKVSEGITEKHKKRLSELTGEVFV